MLVAQEGCELLVRFDRLGIERKRIGESALGSIQIPHAIA
jgi:hypothetical protein